MLKNYMERPKKRRKRRKVLNEWLIRPVETAT